MRMNPSTLIGMVTSVLLLGVVLFFAADDASLYFDWPSLGIVLGGTMAATFFELPAQGGVSRVWPDGHGDAQRAPLHPE